MLNSTCFSSLFALQIALFYVAVLAGLLHRFPVSFSQVWTSMMLLLVPQNYLFYVKLMPVTCLQHSTGQLRKRKSGNPGGAKASEQGEAITFADVAGVDEAKEELEEIVVCPAVHGFIYYTNES